MDNKGFVMQSEIENDDVTRSLQFVKDNQDFFAALFYNNINLKNG